MATPLLTERRVPCRSLPSNPPAVTPPWDIRWMQPAGNRPMIGIERERLSRKAKEGWKLTKEGRMELTDRQLGLLENAVFLWLTILPPVSAEVQRELGELLNQLGRMRSSAVVGGEQSTG